jgi:hypothetical protein
MKRLAFVTIGMASLALAGCNRGNEDSVQNAELNQPDADQLNELANQAAAQNAINEAVQEQNAAVENVVNPIDADEQNVSGM